MYLDGKDSEHFNGCAKVICEATWPWADGVAYSPAEAVNKNKITLVTYIAEPKNGTFERF